MGSLSKFKSLLVLALKFGTLPEGLLVGLVLIFPLRELLIDLIVWQEEVESEEFEFVFVEELIHGVFGLGTVEGLVNGLGIGVVQVAGVWLEGVVEWPSPSLTSMASPVTTFWGLREVSRELGDQSGCLDHGVG